MHTLAPDSDEYVRKPHCVHTLAPNDDEYVPAGQSVHVLGKIAPVAVEYLPTWQLVQEVSGFVEKFPVLVHNIWIRNM